MDGVCPFAHPSAVVDLRIDTDYQYLLLMCVYVCSEVLELKSIHFLLLIWVLSIKILETNVYDTCY